ncbi:unnamed protein product [Amoebophrya sp. A25]|nr:unnamed protein product [Amoebophrya sp. A25]|eukprot:GSA25T00023974001.1
MDSFPAADIDKTKATSTSTSCSPPTSLDLADCPQSFRTFLNRSGISENEYASVLKRSEELPRYIRVKDWWRRRRAEEVHPGSESSDTTRSSDSITLENLRRNFEDAIAIRNRQQVGGSSSSSTTSSPISTTASSGDRVSPNIVTGSSSPEDRSRAGATVQKRRRSCSGNADEAEIQQEDGKNKRKALEDVDLKIESVPWLPGFYAVWPSTVPLASSDMYKRGEIYGCDAASGAAVFALLSGIDTKPKDEQGSSNSSREVLSSRQKFSCDVETETPLRVLDLCCAPGMKFCTIADALVDHSNTSLVGVDVDRQRLNACDTVVAKYFRRPQVLGDASNCGNGDGDASRASSTLRLECADGRDFFIAKEDDPRLSVSNIAGTKGQRKKQRRLDANYQGASSNKDDSSLPSSDGAPVKDGVFDLVLVDAECSHDGSLRHVEKYRSQWGLESMGTRIPWLKEGGEDGTRKEGALPSGVDDTNSQSQPVSERGIILTTSRSDKRSRSTEDDGLQQLLDLQRALLRNGFRNLKPGGTLVYSTCSLSRLQNEDMVEGFLHEETVRDQAERVRLFDEGGSSTTKIPCVSSDEARSMARFDPLKSGTSGLFLAKISKHKMDS